MSWYRAADEITRLAARPGPASLAGDPDRVLLDRGFHELAARFDPENGGFGSAPKFPAPHTLIFLIRYWHLTGETRALAMAEQTLDAIRSGGIWDQIGSGLHRYATDARWRIPHFEKMLCDQALLVLACSEAYEATRQNRYRATADECIAYVFRDLQDPGGAFYSAEDADSPGGEGAYYTWTQEEIDRALGPEDAAVAATLFALAPLSETGAVLGVYLVMTGSSAVFSSLPEPATFLQRGRTSRSRISSSFGMRSGPGSLWHADSVPGLHVTTRSSPMPMHFFALPLRGQAGYSITLHTPAPHPVQCSSFLRT